MRLEDLDKELNKAFREITTVMQQLHVCQSILVISLLERGAISEEDCKRIFEVRRMKSHEEIEKETKKLEDRLLEYKSGK